MAPWRKNLPRAVAIVEHGGMWRGPESESLRLGRTRMGRRSQVGGGLAGFIGVLVLAITPPAPPGAPLDLHQMAIIFIVIGVAGFAVGTFARWYDLD